jgi:hypothetical protein
MMPLSKYKSLLGEEGQSMTDEELLASEEAVYQFSGMAFILWQNEKQLKRLPSKFTLKA